MQFSKISALLITAMAIGAAGAQQAPASTTTKPQTATPTKKATTGSTAAKSTAAAPVALTTQKQKQSYAVGMSLGEILKSRDVDPADIDMLVLTRALRDALANKKPALTEEQFKTVMGAYTAELGKRRTVKEEAESKKNKAEGDAYLATNKTKPGVTVLPSGLQYKVLVQGNGPKPTASDSVVCNYKGTFVDGKEFDSSYKRGEQATFPVTGVIKGWTEALQLMPVGSKWELVIPPDLAYGERGRGAQMPPNSTLVFEVELVKIAEKEKPAPETPQPQATTPDQNKAPDTPQPQGTAQPQAATPDQNKTPDTDKNPK
jgi:FKBP-type peptidyl-prolyl cis-trans isomerase FklB